MIGFLYSTSISADQDNFVIAFRTIKENAKDAFDLIRLVLSSPRFAPEDIARVKQQMVGGLEQRLHLPQPIGKETLQGLVLGENHPYSKRISDRIRKIPEITVEQLQSYMKSSFTQNRMRIVVVGNIGEDDLLAQVNALIQQQPKGDRLPLFMVTPFRGPGKMHAITMDVPQSFVLFAHPGVSRHDPDFYAFFVANSILGGSTFESRLWKEVREKRGLAYGIGANLYLNNLAYGLIGSTATKTETVHQAIDLIKEEWKKFAEHGITQAELDFQKKNIIGGYPLTFGSTLDIVNALLCYRNDGLPIDYINKRNSYFEKLTVEDINSVIKKVFDPALLTFVVVGREAGPEKMQ